jgi:hypothetical protein
LRKYNTSLFGYGKTNDDELDKEKGWDMNTELRREGDKSTQRIMALKWEIICSIIFDGHAPFMSEFTKNYKMYIAIKGLCVGLFSVFILHQRAKN